MNEILQQLNNLTAGELDYVMIRANIILEKKRKEEAEQARLERERQEREERERLERERQEKLNQERLRQKKIEELQQQLRELQGQQTHASVVTTTATKPVSTAPTRTVTIKSTANPTTTHSSQSAQALYCPYCGQKNTVGVRFCGGCGKEIAPSTATKVVQKPSTSASQPRGQVRYVDDSVKQWVLEEGEKSVSKCREIALLQPDAGKKQTVYMEITNKRILLTRQNTTSKNAALVARMGGGLVGGLIAEGIQSATGGDPKPWIEIPLTAVSDCGVQNNKEFFFMADQKYVLKNKGYEKILPDLLMQVRRNL